MNRDPITKVRSKWVVETDSAQIPGIGSDTTIARRRVSDGTLLVLASNEPGIGWHMSMSHLDNRDRHSRYPTWDELADAREVFLPDDVTFVIVFPPASEYVAVHPTTFHLHDLRYMKASDDG